MSLARLVSQFPASEASLYATACPAYSFSNLSANAPIVIDGVLVALTIGPYADSAVCVANTSCPAIWFIANNAATAHVDPPELVVHDSGRPDAIAIRRC